MTIKHFEAIAKVNRARVEHYGTTEEAKVELYTLISEQADVFATFNERFNKSEFMRASGF